MRLRSVPGGMLDIEGARRVLSGRIRWGRGGAVDSALVEGGRESDCSAVLYKCGEGCSDSWPGSDGVCVISVSNWVQERVCSSDSLKWVVLKHQCEEERPERVPLAYPAGGYNVDSFCPGCGAVT
jgi:hypothetical protein